MSKPIFYAGTTVRRTLSAIALGITLTGISAAHASEDVNMHPMSEACWNMKTGSLAINDVYLLGILAKQYPYLLAPIEPVLAQERLKPGDRARICGILDEFHQQPETLIEA